MAARIFGVHDFIGYESKFPQHRVEKLMNLEKNCGLTSRVLIEGPFIELSSDGLPLQQVFLGLTSEELIIVKQKISIYIDITKRDDLELDGLFIDAIFQLSEISFSVSKDQPRTFSVTIPGGKILKYEMCKLDPGFRTQWNIWCNMVSESADRLQLSNNSVEMFSSETPESRQKVVQITSRDADWNSYSDTDISSPDSFDLYADPNRFGALPSRRLAFMHGGNPIHFLSMKDSSRQQTESAVKSSSWSDVTSEHSLSRIDVMSFQKLLQMRDKLNNKYFSSESFYDSCSDGSEDDEEDIDTMVHEARTFHMRQVNIHTTDNKRSGAHLWCRAKQLMLGTSPGGFHKSQLEEALNHFVFQTLSARKKPIARSVLDCRPLEIAQELTVMSKKLLLTIRPRDLEECRNISSSHVPKGLKRLITFGDTVQKFVVAEILCNSVISDRVTTLRFFIDVCYYLLFTKTDFQSLICVLRGMVSLPVYRLHNTWATLLVQEPLKFSQFQAMTSLLSPAGSYKSYRTRVRVCNARNSSYIPWFDHFMVHCKQKSSSPFYLGRKTPHRVDAQKMSRQMLHNNIQPNRITMQDARCKKENKKPRKEIQPLLMPADSTTSKPLKSILKVHEDQKKQKGITRLLGMVKLHRSKTVKFLLSDVDLHRIKKSETKNSNMKHLAKTRLYPVGLRKEFDPAAELVAENKKEINKRLVVMPAIESYCEQKSKEIIHETYKTVATNLSGKEKHQSDRTKVKSREQKSDDADSKPEGDLTDMAQQSLTSDKLTTCVKEIPPEKVKPHKKNPITKLMKTYKKTKEKRRTKKDIKHVNYLQSEIDSVNTLLEGFNHMKYNDTDKDEDETTDTVSDAKGQGQTNARLAVPNDKHPDKERGNKAERKENRRKSYVPASVIENRRVSLFEQAFDDNKDQKIDKVFSRSIEMRLKGLQGRRKSVAMELLENDETLGIGNEQYQNSCNNSIDGKATSRFFRYFDPEKSNKNLCLKSCSLENLGTSCVGNNGCTYCGGDACIYSGSIYDHLILLQTNALNAHERSSKRVKECLRNMMNAVTSFSDYDLMVLSFSRE